MDIKVKARCHQCVEYYPDTPAEEFETLSVKHIRINSYGDVSGELECSHCGATYKLDCEPGYDGYPPISLASPGIFHKELEELRYKRRKKAFIKAFKKWRKLRRENRPAYEANLISRRRTKAMLDNFKLTSTSVLKRNTGRISKFNKYKRSLKE